MASVEWRSVGGTPRLTDRSHRRAVVPWDGYVPPRSGAASGSARISTMSPFPMPFPMRCPLFQCRHQRLMSRDRCCASLGRGSGDGSPEGAVALTRQLRKLHPATVIILAAAVVALAWAHLRVNPALAEFNLRVPPWYTAEG